MTINDRKRIGATMDVSLITDLNQLKAMAYDFLVGQEAAQNNLKIVNNRIAELMEAQPAPAELPVGSDPATIVAEPDIAPDSETPKEDN